MTDPKNKKRRSLFRLTALLLTVSLFSCAVFPGRRAYAGQKKEIIVAVIDTGVNIDHEYLKEHIWVNKDEIPGNGMDDDENGFVDDVYGWDFYNNDATVFHDIVYGSREKGYTHEEDHGTHIAGIIARLINESRSFFKKVSDVDVKIMVLKINGGEKSVGKTGNAVKAIEYAEKKGAVICNLSWGGYENDSELWDVMRKSSMYFMCCAGNDGTDNDEKPMYPASYDLENVISVTNGLKGFEKTVILGNYGKNTVDLSADGYEVWSTVPHGFDTFSGASMATAMVSGAAAVLMSVGDCTAKEAYELIRENAEYIPDYTGVRIKGGYCDTDKLFKKMAGIFKAKKEKKVAAMLLNYNEITLKTGEGFTLKCFVLPKDPEVALYFGSSDTEVCEVSYNGLVTCKKQGDAVVTVRTKTGIEGSCVVHVR
ncbi:MAG: S8 family serine peptidase [Lachnospiraceae bacterium]|nr:S8 family serine peptidase [Lachnospiraceae bacterium]